MGESGILALSFPTNDLPLVIATVLFVNTETQNKVSAIEKYLSGVTPRPVSNPESLSALRCPETNGEGIRCFQFSRSQNR
ncbi:Enolase-phosphatase E1 [Fusarium oxysporum f. sp. albedinis]|nr:Enolase-phosphatase E1 [Fusarium oxysporum f. sp. albedinis]